MKDRTEISYYYGNEHILTTVTSKVPELGEEIYFNTQMDEEWHDARFPNRKLFKTGVRGKYVVIDVNRYYKNYDYIAVETSNSKVYEFPAQYTVETFEVKIEKTK